MLFLIVQYNGNNNRGDEKSDKTKNILFIYLFSFLCGTLYYVAD